MRQAVNCKRDRRGNDVVDLNPRLVTEHAHEEEQRYILDDGNQHSRSDVIDAVGERHEEDDHGQKEIDDDQMAIVLRVVIGENGRIDHRKDGDEERHRVDDPKAPLHGPRIAVGAELKKSGERTQPHEHRRGPRRRVRSMFTHENHCCIGGWLMVQDLAPPREAHRSAMGRRRYQQWRRAMGRELQKLSSKPPVPWPRIRSKSRRFCSWMIAFCCSRASTSALRQST